MRPILKTLFTGSELARSRLGIWALILGAFASGCAVGPNYKQPKTNVPGAFSNAPQSAFTTNASITTWWREFDDPKLNQLIDLALSTNYDLRIATAHLLEARAIRRRTQFDFWPVPNASAGYTKTRFSDAALFGNTQGGREQELYDAGFDATWELDFFGRVRRSIQASTADVQSAAAQRNDVLVSLISELARTYCSALYLVL